MEMPTFDLGFIAEDTTPSDEEILRIEEDMLNEDQDEPLTIQPPPSPEPLKLELPETLATQPPDQLYLDLAIQSPQPLAIQPPPSPEPLDLDMSEPVATQTHDQLAIQPPQPLVIEQPPEPAYQTDRFPHLTDENIDNLVTNASSDNTKKMNKTGKCGG